MSEPGATHLDNHHRRTAQAILSHPISHNIEWREVISLLEVIGDVTEEHNGTFKVRVGGETETLHRPSGKDLGDQTVVDLRRMLGSAGITAAGLRERKDVDTRPTDSEHAAGPARDHGDGRWGEN